ncbi:MAG: hypothetical protein AABX70_09180 [Nanoarchaeota archaeon]
MPQNRNKRIELFIANLTNVIVHRILEIAVDNKEIASKYKKEIEASLKLTKKYREQINPIQSPLPEKQALAIRQKLLNKAEIRLSSRISQGYKNLHLDQVEEFVEAALKELKII